MLQQLGTTIEQARQTVQLAWPNMDEGPEPFLKRTLRALNRLKTRQSKSSSKVSSDSISQRKPSCCWTQATQSHHTSRSQLSSTSGSQRISMPDGGCSRWISRPCSLHGSSTLEETRTNPLNTHSCNDQSSGN